MQMDIENHLITLTDYHTKQLLFASINFKGTVFHTHIFSIYVAAVQFGQTAFSIFLLHFCKIEKHWYLIYWE